MSRKPGPELVGASSLVTGEKQETQKTAEAGVVWQDPCRGAPPECCRIFVTMLNQRAGSQAPDAARGENFPYVASGAKALPDDRDNGCYHRELAGKAGVEDRAEFIDLE